MIDHSDRPGDPTDDVRRDECAGFEPLLAAYADGPLREHDYRSLMNHLERCERCFLTVASGALIEPIADSKTGDPASDSPGDSPGDSIDDPGQESPEFEAALVPIRTRPWRIAGLAAAVVLAAAITLLLVLPRTATDTLVADRDATRQDPVASEQREQRLPRPEPALETPGSGEMPNPGPDTGPDTGPDKRPDTRLDNGPDRNTDTRDPGSVLRAIALPTETAKLAHDLLGSLHTSDGVEIALFATWRKAPHRRSKDQLLRVTLRSNVADDRRWTGHAARKTARELARQDEPHRTETVTSRDGEHRLSFALHHRDGQPWQIIVAVADRQLVVGWPKQRHEPATSAPRGAPDTR